MQFCSRRYVELASYVEVLRPVLDSKDASNIEKLIENLRQHGHVWSVRPPSWDNVEAYAQYHGGLPFNQALTEIEISENQFFIGNNEDKFSMVLCRAEGIGDFLLKKLQNYNPSIRWAVTVSIQPVLGDYDELPVDLRNATVQQHCSAPWWLEARISFCAIRTRITDYLWDRYCEEYKNNALPKFGSVKIS